MWPPRCKRFVVVLLTETRVIRRRRGLPARDESCSRRTPTPLKQEPWAAIHTLGEALQGSDVSLLAFVEFPSLVSAQRQRLAMHSEQGSLDFRFRAGRPVRRR